MRCYTVKKASGPVPLIGDVEGTVWQQAEVVGVDNWPWYKSGDKQATEARVLWDDDAVYVQFHCQDKHIYAGQTELNDNVYKDSCVEFFANSSPDEGQEYFNFEANCCGTFHVGFGSGRHGRRLIDADVAKGIEVVTSVPGPTKDESPDDDGWWLAAKLPLRTLSEFTARPVCPHAGDRWRANFYRIGGKTDVQHACWSRIDLPTADYHSPDFFGELLFA